MKTCRYCGTEIEDNAIFCKNCGARTNGETPRANYFGYDNMYGTGRSVNYDDRGSALVAAVSFLMWQAGLVIWLVTRQTSPGKSRSALKGMLASLAFSMPIVGLVIWLAWKDDAVNKEYAKIGGIAAIAGFAFNLIVIVVFAVLKSMGIKFMIDIMPEVLDGMIFKFFRF